MFRGRLQTAFVCMALIFSQPILAGLAGPLMRINSVMWNLTGSALGVKVKGGEWRGPGDGYSPLYLEKTASEATKSEDLHTTVTFDDIAGLQGPLAEVKEVVEFLKNPTRFKALGAQMPRGILLEGPPGTGKTLIAKAIANETKCEFVYASASEFVEMYVGVGAKKIRELFEKARKNKPAIIFIDELDAIGAVYRGAGGNEEYRQTLNELLTQLDGFKADDNIMVLAATNYAAALDKALTRSGRFDRIIKVSLPDASARKDILRLYSKKLPSAQLSEEALEATSLRTNGLGGADLKNIINEAALAAVRDQSAFVTDDHLAKACDKVIQQRRK